MLAVLVRPYFVTHELLRFGIFRGHGGAGAGAALGCWCSCSGLCGNNAAFRSVLSHPKGVGFEGRFLLGSFPNYRKQGALHVQPQSDWAKCYSTMSHRIGQKQKPDQCSQPGPLGSRGSALGASIRTMTSTEKWTLCACHTLTFPE